MQKDFFMRTKFIFILLTAVFFSAFSQQKDTSDMQISNKALFKKITKQDSGYLQKKDALYILSRANVVDTTDEYYKKEYEKYIKQKQTIAKYYKKTNGNYIILIRNYLDYRFMSNIFVEFSPQGNILKKEIYFHSCCWKSTIFEDFNKFGDFFCLKVCECAMGGVYENDLYIFKEIVPADSLNFIPFWCYVPEAEYDSITNKITGWECSSKIKKIENDTLIINYFPKKIIWRDEEKDKKIIDMEPFDILYIYKDNQWHIAHKEDYEKFENTCFDMNFNFRF